MARTFPNSTSNSLKQSASITRTNFPGNAEVFTLSAWIKLTTNDATDRTILAKYGSDGRGPIMRTISGKIRMFWIDLSSSGHEAIGATTMSTGVWYHVAATWPRSTSPGMQVWLNGTVDGSNTENAFMHGNTDVVDGWCIGVRGNSGNADTFPFNGDIAEVAMWNVTLGADEIASLAKGVSPMQIRPLSLKGYWPIFGDYDNGIDYSSEASTGLGPNNMSLVGTLATADHPPVGMHFPEWDDYPPMVQAGPTVVILGQPSETDTANTVSPNRLHVIALATETDIANVIQHVKSAVVGTALEVDTANQIIVIRTPLLGLATETDIANTIHAHLSSADHTIIGMATELDEAQQICAIGGRNAWIITLVGCTGAGEAATITPSTTSAGTLTAGATVSAATLSGSAVSAGTLTGTVVDPDDFTGALPFYDPDCDDTTASGGSC